MNWKEVLERVQLILAFVAGLFLGGRPVPPPPVLPSPPPPIVQPPLPLPPLPLPPSPLPPVIPRDPKDALLTLYAGSSQCSATVIGPRRADGSWDVLSAAHCVGSIGQRVSLRTRGGRKISGVVTVRAARPDIAWIKTEVIEDLHYLLLSRSVPEVNEPIWHSGTGRDRPGNVERGVVTVPSDSNGMWRGRISVSPGDSGCGIISERTGEVIGTLYGTGGNLTIGGHCASAWAHRPAGPGPSP